MPDWQDKLAFIAQRNRQEIVQAKLSRREMVRLGLLTPAGTLVAKAGLSSRAHAQSGSNTGSGSGSNSGSGGSGGSPSSPSATPWVQPMPIVQPKTPLAPAALQGGFPDGTTLVDGGTRRVKHQLFTADPAARTFGGAFPPEVFYEFMVKEVGRKFHPDWRETSVWGFDGTFPGPRINARYGEPVLVRHHNHLPSKARHVGFGMPEISTHLHNGHTPTESDGYPEDFFNSIKDPSKVNPLGFKDHHYPNVYAGFARLGGLGDPNEALGSMWYHDHRVDFTSQNVYKGLAGFYTIFDRLDTGDETSGLHLPSGEFDVPIMFTDPLFDRNHQLVFDPFNTDGHLGDRFCANGAIQPFFNVRARRYRLRLYNPGPSRWYQFALHDGARFLPFWQIASDGNLLPQALERTSVVLSPAERADIIVDFGKIRSQARRLYLVNRIEQVDGRRPTGKILTPGIPIVQIDIGEPATDNSADPGAGPLKLRPLPDPDAAALKARAAKTRQRTFRFDRSNGAWTVNGRLFDPEAPAVEIPVDSEEVWLFQSNSGGWSHPIHPHLEEFRVLSRNGAAISATSVEYGRKDVAPLGPNEEVRVFMRFRDLKGRYVMHCHNSVHEDVSMMIRFDTV